MQGKRRFTEENLAQTEESGMYKRHNGQMSLFEQPEFFGGLPLNPKNEWVILAKMLPWETIEERYLQTFQAKRMGQPAINARMVVGSQIIKSWYNISDERVVAEIAMNPYLQFFLGLTEYQYECPFDASNMSRFRKRITPELMTWLNDLIVGYLKPEEEQFDPSDEDENDNNDGQEEENENEGTLILDATCIPQDIRFPTDVSLLNEARLDAEAIIDVFHKQGFTDGRKPRTYRQKAKKQYNSFSKQRKKTRKSIRRATGQQLRYLRRDLNHIRKILEKHPEALQFLSKRQYRNLLVIQEVYRQQEEMYRNNTHQIDHRIVSISQPWIRPIVRGKQSADVEFGAKVEMSVHNGYLRLEWLSWEAFNESTTLKASVEHYRKVCGHYPERVLADKIFRTRENRRYCKEHNIHLNGPKLGRKPADPEVYKKQLQEEWRESGERGEIEREFGVGKRRFSLGCLMTRLQHTSEVFIMTTVLVMNLRKKLRLLLRSFYQCFVSMCFALCCVLQIYSG